MKLNKIIEIWFSDSNKSHRDYIEVKNIIEAKEICKKLSIQGCTCISIDIMFKDKDGELIEEKSKWYSWKNNKLNKI